MFNRILIRIENRWIVLISAITIQVILGGVYAWSTFIPSLINEYKYSIGQSGFIFGLTIAIFAITMALSGRLIAKKSSRFISLIGSLLYMSGYLLASFSNGNYIILLISNGIIVGAAIGFAYLGPLAVCLKWFPNKKGLITGITVSGFGGGSILLSSVAQYFLSGGMDVLSLFRMISLVQGPVLIIASLFLINPNTSKFEAVIQNKRIRLKNLISVPFPLFMIGMFAGTFSGLLIIGNLVPLIINSGNTSAIAIKGVSFFAFGNALGRILWGYLFDKIKYKSIPLSLFLFALVTILLLSLINSQFIVLISGLAGFCFGANFVIYAAGIIKYFGDDLFPLIYPVCFLGYGAAGFIGPWIGGVIADITGSFEKALLAAVILMTATGVVTLIGFNKINNFQRIQH